MVVIVLDSDRDRERLRYIGSFLGPKSPVNPSGPDRKLNMVDILHTPIHTH